MIWKEGRKNPPTDYRKVEEKEVNYGLSFAHFIFFFDCPRARLQLAQLNFKAKYSLCRLISPPWDKIKADTLTGSSRGFEIKTLHRYAMLYSTKSGPNNQLFGYIKRLFTEHKFPDRVKVSIERNGLNKQWVL